MQSSEVRISIPIGDWDNGELQVFEGYRVEHNNARSAVVEEVFVSTKIPI